MWISALAQLPSGWQSIWVRKVKTIAKCPSFEIIPMAWLHGALLWHCQGFQLSVMLLNPQVSFPGCSRTLLLAERFPCGPQVLWPWPGKQRPGETWHPELVWESRSLHFGGNISCLYVVAFFYVFSKQKMLSSVLLGHSTRKKELFYSLSFAIYLVYRGRVHCMWEILCKNWKFWLLKESVPVLLFWDVKIFFSLVVNIAEGLRVFLFGARFL